MENKDMVSFLSGLFRSPSNTESKSNGLSSVCSLLAFIVFVLEFSSL